MTDLFFPVVERPLDVRCRDGHHDPVSSHKAICRVDPSDNVTPLVLGVVGSDYKVVRNADLFGAVETAMDKIIPDEHMNQAQIRDRTAHNGAFSLREYIFPSMKVPLRERNGKETGLGYRSVLWNTYDGSGAAKLLTGAIDFWCTNGIISGEFEIFKRRHTSGFKIPQFGDLIETNVAMFQARAAEWQRWAQLDITREQAQAVLKELPGISERRAEKLAEHYDYEAHQRGASVWALYSVLTWFASHAEGHFKTRNTGADHLAQTMQRREEQVLIWIDSKAWKALTDR